MIMTRRHIACSDRPITMSCLVQFQTFCMNNYDKTPVVCKNFIASLNVKVTLCHVAQSVTRLTEKPEVPVRYPVRPILSLPLPLIQEGQLPLTGEKNHFLYWLS